MFDRYVQDRGRRRLGRWIRVAIAASAVAHVGVGAALIVSAWWKIEKLSVEDRQVAIASFGMPTAAPPPLAGEQRNKTRRELARVREATQPRQNDAETPEDGGGDGSATGHANGLAGGEGDDPDAPNALLGCAGLECLGDQAPPEPRKTPAKPPVIPESMLKGHLISGETQIHAPREVKLAMTRAGVDRLRAAVKLCIDAEGAVESTRLLRSTGYSDYDRRLLAGVRRWRYRPYRIGGEAVAVCTAVQFVYLLRP
jgi:protein TonB